ncbi:MAG: SPOR domain-containing protein [Alphaproteobacteria bacterium]|nr:SPOR domain-containing protein [Alphaproteobacteria bacterium]
MNIKDPFNNEDDNNVNEDSFLESLENADNYKKNFPVLILVASVATTAIIVSLVSFIIFKNNDKQQPIIIPIEKAQDFSKIIPVVGNDNDNIIRVDEENNLEPVLKALNESNNKKVVENETIKKISNNKIEDREVKIKAVKINKNVTKPVVERSIEKAPEVKKFAVKKVAVEKPVVKKPVQRKIQATKVMPVNKIPRGFHVQMVSYNNERSAKVKIAQLKQKYPDFFSKANIIIVPGNSKGKRYYRVRIVDLVNVKEADALCGKIKSQLKLDCFSIKY